MEQERLEREWHHAMQQWEANPAAEKDKGAKPVRPVRQPSALPVVQSTNPAIDLFALEPAIDYSNFASISYQPVITISYHHTSFFVPHYRLFIYSYVMVWYDDYSHDCLN